MQWSSVFKVHTERYFFTYSQAESSFFPLNFTVFTARSADPQTDLLGETLAVIRPRDRWSYCKGTVQRDFRPFYKIRPGHHMNRHKRFRELFRFREDFRSQSSKIACQHSQQLCVQANFFFIYGHFTFEIIAIGFVNTSSTFFHLIDPLKSVRGLQVSWKCPRSFFCGPVVIDYADTVPA